MTDTIKMKIHNIKNIDDFEFDIPAKKGLYALAGENAVGKSTVLSCAATAFYGSPFYDYFGKPREDASIQFNFNERKREIKAIDGEWPAWEGLSALGISGFYEGSIVFGNRFKDIEYDILGKLSAVSEKDLTPAPEEIRKSLGNILHGNSGYYENLFVLNKGKSKKLGLRRSVFYYKNKGGLFSQLNMSTGENLLLTILNSIYKRVKKKAYGGAPIFLFLDEVELALHSSALTRLVEFLKNIVEQKNMVVLFSTHSIELLRSIPSYNIYYLQKHINGKIETINPCYPVYATRKLEDSTFGYDYVIFVEDVLAKQLVERILNSRRLLSNKRVLTIAVGGWMQVLRLAYDIIRSNFIRRSTNLIIVLDRDIKDQVANFLKTNHIGFEKPINYLPVPSLEKYLYRNICINLDMALVRELDDYLFQMKSVETVAKEFGQSDGCSNGKGFFGNIRNELRRLNKTEDDLVERVLQYLFDVKNEDLKELVEFLERQLT